MLRALVSDADVNCNPWQRVLQYEQLPPTLTVLCCEMWDTKSKTVLMCAVQQTEHNGEPQ